LATAALRRAAVIGGALCAACASSGDRAARADRPASVAAPSAAPAATGHRLKCPEHEATVCASRCTDTDGDAANCGRCGAACAAVCKRGRCTAVAELTMGSGHGCARFDDGTVRCWGTDLRGQIGDGQVNISHAIPVEVPDLGGVVRVTAGAQSTCVVLEAGGVQCWGDIVERSQPSVPVGVGRPLAVPIDGVAQLSVGAYSSCAVTAAGAVLCWGANDSGELGDGTRNRRREPRPVRGVTDAVEVAVGWAHACARSRDGSVRCWGSNAEGQLGGGIRVDRGLAAKVPRLPPAKQLAAGQHHTCALLEAGTVQCWGANRAGQLGDGSRDDRFGVAPVAVHDLASVRAISAGRGDGTCALLEDGTLRCWGRFRALSTFSRNVSLTPQPVPELTDVVEVAAGGSALCARKADGTVWCWGHELDGRGRPIDRPEPTRLEW
jgi:alpha-tubulin suppressor-like RCC1 family protein